MIFQIIKKNIQSKNALGFGKKKNNKKPSKKKFGYINCFYCNKKKKVIILWIATIEMKLMC